MQPAVEGLVHRRWEAADALRAQLCLRGARKGEAGHRRTQRGGPGDGGWMVDIITIYIYNIYIYSVYIYMRHNMTDFI